MIKPEKIKPFGDRILVRRHAFDDRTSGGLIIPAIAQNGAPNTKQRLRRGRGTVLAVGPGRHETIADPAGRMDGEGRRLRVWADERTPPDVKVGDVVMFSILADLGDLDELGLDDLTVLAMDEVLGVLEDGNDA